MKIAVLGSGVAGLSAAYYLKKSFKEVYLIEGKRGGWIESIKRKNILETGPRSLRHTGSAGQNTLDLIYELNLHDKVEIVGKDSPAAKERFIYYQGQLNRLSADPTKLLFSNTPILKGVLPSLLKEPFQPKSMKSDESIEEFVTRRLGPHIANNIFSAVIHGIYAGDTSKLSVKSCFKGMWEMDSKYGSFFNAILKSIGKPSDAVYKSSNPKAQEFMDYVSKQSVYSFKGGLQTLSDRLFQLITEQGVHVIPGECSGLYFENSKVRINLKSNTNQHSMPSSFDHVFSAIPSHNLSQILEPKYDALKLNLDTIPSVNVAVVNLIYTKSKLPVQGFGFLVPKSESLPILGIVFDSVAFPQGEDVVLSVMMGGHNFDKLFGEVKKVDKSRLLQVAIDSASKSLGIPKENLVDSFVSVHEKCIPQYIVGHEDRLKQIDSLTQDLPISLIGASYRGVSVNDCIYNAKLAVERFVKINND